MLRKSINNKKQDMKENRELVWDTIKKMGGTVSEVDKERTVDEAVFGEKKFLFSHKFFVRAKYNFLRDSALYKDLMAKLLLRKDIATPKTVFIGEKITDEEVKKIILNWDYPIVVKYAEGSKSKGIFMNLKDEESVLKVVREQIGVYKKMVIQEMVFGDEYRILILDDKLIGALRMVPPFVVGDGKKNILNLMHEKQEKTVQRTKEDEALKIILQEQDEDFNSVPKSLKKVYLKRNSCLDEGGITVECTDEIDEKMIEICHQAAESAGIKLAGIDVKCKDLKGSFENADKNFSIIEVNSKPDLNIHYYPNEGNSRDVATEILEYIVNKL